MQKKQSRNVIFILCIIISLVILIPTNPYFHTVRIDSSKINKGAINNNIKYITSYSEEKKGATDSNSFVKYIPIVLTNEENGITVEKCAIAVPANFMTTIVRLSVDDKKVFSGIFPVRALLPGSIYKSKLIDLVNCVNNQL